MNTNDSSEIQSDHAPAPETPPTSTSDVAIADVILTRPFSTGLIEFTCLCGESCLDAILHLLRLIA